MFHVKQFCLIGYPIEHSLSPLIHNKICEVLGLNDNYTLNSCQEIDIDDLKKYVGFNITMPHKVNIIPYLDELTETAERINSVNTVKIEEGKLIGHSTDGQGLLRDFHRVFKTDFYNKNICILGTGATSRAVSFEILKECPKNIYYLSQTKKDKNIFSYKAKEVVKDCEIIINTTPVGMYDEKCLLSPGDINKNMLIYDVIYNKKTPLMMLGEASGARVASGMGMLIYQAILSREFWENSTISEMSCERIIREVINEKE